MERCRCLLLARRKIWTTSFARSPRASGKPHRLRSICGKPNAGDRIVEFALKASARLDIVVNNAGATRRGAFVKLTDEDWADSFALNFWSGAPDARGLASPAEECRFRAVYFRGRWKAPGAEFAAGGAVNAGLLSLTKALAEAGIRDGVQVNTVNPGAVRTDRLKVRLESMTKEQGIDLAAAERRFVEGSGVTRIGEPEDIAALAAFVVGPEGRFLHGSLIDMDGGATKTV